MRNWFYLAPALLLFAGCADSHRVNMEDLSGVKLATEGSIYIAIPDDGVYGDRTYKGSGVNTAHIIRSAFAKHTNSATVSESVQSMDEALATAKARGFSYLIYPTILHWEDRATEWSGIPDRVEVKMVIVDVAAERVLGSAIVNGKSGLATFGGDHPQDLLPEPIEAFVSSLF